MQETGIYWGASAKYREYHQQQFEEFLSLPPEDGKIACSDREGNLRHIISAEHFDKPFLENNYSTAHAARRIAKLRDGYLSKLLPSYAVLNYFAQPSTRTYLSFSRAEAQLGMMREDVRDIKTSSFSKGESDKDTLRTVSSYFDVMVCRHSSDYFGLFCVWVMNGSRRPISMINAGSGTKEHPTQALADFYTISESFKQQLDHKVVAYVGDCLRGRTIHSLAKILSLYSHQTAIFVAPEHLQIDAQTEHYIAEKGTIVKKETTGLETVIADADVIYMTRVQSEHGGSEQCNPDFIFRKEFLNSMRKGAILMHPMPKREEIDPELDDLRDPRLMYWRQERNGMWARVALLAQLFQKDEQIRQHYANMEKSVTQKPIHE